MNENAHKETPVCTGCRQCKAEAGVKWKGRCCTLSFHGEIGGGGGERNVARVKVTLGGRKNKNL